MTAEETKSIARATGGYNGELVKEAAEQVLPPELAISGLSTPALFVGNGAMLYQALIRDRLGDGARVCPELPEYAQGLDRCMDQHETL